MSTMPSLKKFQETIEKVERSNITENLSEEAYNGLEGELGAASSSGDHKILLGIFRELNPEYDSWERILEDNPGLLEVMGEWLLEWVDRNPDWRSAIEDRYRAEDPDAYRKEELPE